MSPVALPSGFATPGAIWGKACKHQYDDLAVVRSETQPLPAGSLTLTVTGHDGSAMHFVFTGPAVDMVNGAARRTELLRLNGWLLRLGNYRLDVIVDGAAASTAVEVYSHIRKSSFTLLAWGSRAKGNEVSLLGEDGMGFNLLYGGGTGDASVRGGLDYTGCCVMSGAHQMDLRMECDWSDPNVLGGGTVRAVRAAQQFRSQANARGVHCYDAPGLTWWADPETGETTPHGVPAHVQSFQRAFGNNPPRCNVVRRGCCP